MKSITQRLGRYVLFTAIGLFAVPLTVNAQDHGSGGGGGGGCGDVFGDLIHILRDDLTGQPILAQRWVELPADEPGFGWGYCPIAVHYVDGIPTELPFAPFSCEVAPAYAELVEEVDYFGRLNGGRTKPRNHRMHFNEVISNIKQADKVSREETGRLKIGFDCAVINDKVTDYCDWATVDSPMESMALYVRTMKYGHLATDPYEIDQWAHGDPKKYPQFHPALEAEDWAKFDTNLKHLLPNNGKNPESCYGDTPETFVDNAENGEVGVWDPPEPFADMNKNCVRDQNEPFEDLDGDDEWDAGDTLTYDIPVWTPENEYEYGNCIYDEFVYLCADPEELKNSDFISGSTYLAAAAPKTGKITVDLKQYMNRILSITQEKGYMASTVNTLPALYRDCWDEATMGEHPDDPEEDGEWEDPEYLEECGDPIPAENPADLASKDDFPDLFELFVDYSALNEYEREFDDVMVILEGGSDSWVLADDQSLEEWVEDVNGSEIATENIDGAVAVGNDVVRAIEYVHNYDPPEDLYCKYIPDDCL